MHGAAHVATACSGPPPCPAAFHCTTHRGHKQGPRLPTCLAALTMPDAMTSQRMMPPKMLTRMAFTCA